MIKGLLLDIDGVLYVGNEVIKGAIETVEWLKKHYKLAFITNTSRKPLKDIHEKLRNLGFSIEKNEIFTALSGVKEFLKKQKTGAYLLLTEKAKEDFKDIPKEPIKYVVIGDAWTNFNYENLNKAFRYLIEGAELIAVAKNKYFLDKDKKLSLDVGPFVKALEFASGKKARVIGKPSKDFFYQASKYLGLNPEEIAVVGDDIEADVKGAMDSNMIGILVKTGKFREEDLQKGIKPDFIIDSIAELPSLLSKTLSKL